VRDNSFTLTLEDDIDVIANDLIMEPRCSIDKGAILGMAEGGCERTVSDNDSFSVE
jgi:hypothetical protein